MDYLIEFENHLKYASGGVSDLTVASYLSDVQQFLKWCNLDPTNANRSIIRQYNKHLLEDRRLSKSSINRKIASLRSFYGFLCEETGMSSNPMSGVKSFRIEELTQEEKESKVLTLREVENLLGLASRRTHIGLRDRAILHLLFETGIRKNECRQLEKGDLSPSLDKLTIRSEVAKRGRPREIPIVSNATIDALSEYLTDARPKFRNADTSPALFLSKMGRFISPSSMGDIVTKYGEKLGSEKRITPHTLRHSFASLTVNNGVPLPDVQAALGHQKLSTTQIYLHTDLDSMRKNFAAKHPLNTSE